MKTNTSVVLLSTALAIVGGLFGAQSSGLFSDASDSGVISNSGFMTGHLTMYTTDSETGMIKEYRQSDNRIVNGGENCAAKLLFRGSAAGNSVCTGANTEGFNFIAIGTGGSTAAANEQASLETEATSAGLSTPIQGNIVWTNSTATGTTAGGATVEITSVFTNTGASQNIDESGLFNSTDTTDGMFARQVFTAIPVDTNDSLTVEWTISLGGGTVT